MVYHCKGFTTIPFHYCFHHDDNTRVGDHFLCLFQYNFDCVLLFMSFIDIIINGIFLKLIFIDQHIIEYS